MALLCLLGVGAAATPLRTRAAALGEEPFEVRFARTLDEVRRVAAEYHARLPRAAAAMVGAAYARYSTRHQDSVADQVRAIFEDAVRKKVFIPVEHIYFDLAVRGCKSHRAGLGQLQACLARRGVRVVFLFATNRLFRKMHHSLRFVEEEVVERGIRAVFVKSGVDTADERTWKAMMTIAALTDEFVVVMHAEHIRAAQEGMFARQLVFGSLCLGYTGEPIPGEFTRLGKPRRTIVIDPTTADWVRKVYRWFVEDRVGVPDIARRLNADPDAPPPPKSPQVGWTPASVRGLLRNTRYRGLWRYGVTRTVWVSSKDYTRKEERVEPLKEAQLEDLRLVDDRQWYAAQSLLHRDAARYAGRKPRDGNRTSRPRVLNGFFFCPVHQRPLQVGGGHGRYMHCKACLVTPAAERPLYSHLPRALALAKVCRALADELRRDDALVEQVVAAMEREAARLQTPDPARAGHLADRVARVDRQVAFLVQNLGETPEDRAESAALLRRLRQERADLRAEQANATAASPPPVPSRQEVQALIADLAGVLERAGGGGDPEDAGLLRRLVEELTGGRIDLVQMGQRAGKRGWLRGVIRLRPVGAVAGRVGGSGEGEPRREVVVDFREEHALPAGLVDEAMRLYGQGLLVKQIVARLGEPRSKVARALEEGFARRGEAVPDGRSRRTHLAVRYAEPPKYQAVADDVVRLAGEGLTFSVIRTRLGIDSGTLRSAWRYWHQSRGLPVPDGRARRKSLRRR